MIVWIAATLAAAAPPPHADVPAVPTDVTGAVLTRATPFVLAEPVPYDWEAGRPSMRDGVLLAFSAPGSLLLQRQVGQPTFYAGATPVALVYANPDAGCAVGYVRGAPDWSIDPFFAGSAELPERIDAAAGAAERAAALRAGAVPQQPPVAPTQSIADLRALYALVIAEAERCAPGDALRLDPLRRRAGLP